MNRQLCIGIILFAQVSVSEAEHIFIPSRAIKIMSCPVSARIDYTIVALETFLPEMESDFKKVGHERMFPPSNNLMMKSITPY